MRDEREHSECVCIAEADMQAGRQAGSQLLALASWLGQGHQGPLPYYAPAHMQHADT